MPKSPGEGSGRKYPARPIVGVAGLLFEDNEALLIRRAKEPGFGQWSIPGGAVKVGETLAEALAREMQEEAGLIVTAGPLVEVVERIFADPEGRIMYHYVVLDYICYRQSGTLTPGSDASEARFVPRDKWADYELPGITIEVLEKGLAMYKAVMQR